MPTRLLAASLQEALAIPAPSPAPRAARLFQRPAGALPALLAAVFCAYAPALGGQLLWDDNALVRGNTLIRSPLLCLEAFRHTLFGDSSNFYRPTQTLLFIADYYCGGLNPFGYHLASVLLQAANACLLFLLLRQLVPRLLPAAPSALIPHPSSLIPFFVALLWAVHPVHSAAVAYVSGSADSLAMLFCVAAWLLGERALRADRPPARAGWSAGAFACLLLGLCSKEVAFVWLLFFAVSLCAAHPAPARRRWGAVAAGALALGCCLALRHLPPVPPPHPPYPPLPSRWLLMIRALGDYGSLMLFPAKLFMERQVFAAPGLANPADEGVYRALAWAGAAMLAAFAGGAVWPGRGRTLRRVGAGWFLIAFLPMSNLFTLNASVAEHWLYLSSIGFLLFLGGAALDLPPGLRSRRAGLSVVLLAAGALGARTWVRSHDWLDELTFFRQTVENGGDVPRAREGLAAAYRRAGSNADAIPVLRGIVAKYPAMLGSTVNLANALARQGERGEARALLEGAAARLFAGTASDPRVLLAVAGSLDQLEDGDPAWPAHRRALLARGMRQNPDSWEMARFAMQDCRREDRPDEGLTIARRYAGAHWWHAAAQAALGESLALAGQTDAALAAWTRASRLDVWDADSLHSAATLCLETHRSGQARALQAAALRRQPDSPRQHAFLAQVLSQCGDPAGAAAEMAEANRLLASVSAVP